MPKTITPRQAAAYDLLKWSEKQKIRYRDRSFFQRTAHYSVYRCLVSDVIRHWRKYAFFIEKLAARNIAKLDREVVVCLMLGISCLENDNTAEHAAVNETVNLIATLSKPFLKGFVNANLRAFIKNKKTLFEKLQTQSLAVRTSHSDQMAERWRHQYGEKIAGAICEANNIPPQVRIVINPHFNKNDILSELVSLNYETADCGSSGYIIKNPSGLFETALAKSGTFLVQDKSYQFINDLIKKLPGEKVLDACAAPGGKLFNLEWARGSEIEELIATDISAERIKRMELNQKRFQSKAKIIQMDALKPAFKQQFDLILADVPCAATGVIRKHPEIKWNRQPSDFQNNQKLQLSILEKLQNCLKTGGHLLYTTCSLEKEENQEVIETFLKSRGQKFRLVSLSDLMGQEFLTAEGYYQCFPQASVMGSFGALIQKK